MNICAGLIRPSIVWEQFLAQEGIPFGAIHEPEDLTPERWSVCIVNGPLGKHLAETVSGYLRAGGAVLAGARYLRGIAGIETRPERLEYLVGEGISPFPELMLLDLGLAGEIPREAATVRSQFNTHSIFAGDCGGGAAVLLPFDPELALADRRTVVKNFFARPDRLPSERVSLVSKGEVRHLLRWSLEFLHLHRGIPYVHLWYYPDLARNVFGVRVDTDFSSRGDIDALYAVARSAGSGMTWFLDVKSHEPLLPRFESMIGQEVGVHCFDHRVTHSLEGNLANFGKAKRILEDAGFTVAGFAAPQGVWNPALAAATDKLGFSYSSEFSWVYDSLPARPAEIDRLWNTLQVPVHPICVGSLRRVGYNEAQMREYFSLMFEWKMARREPLLFYHHPSHRHEGVIEWLFSIAEERRVPRLTLGEYAKWWTVRQTVALEIRWSGRTLELEFPAECGPRESVGLRVLVDSGKEAFVPIAPRVDLDQCAWHQKFLCLPPSDIRRIRDVDPRRMLGDLYERMTRRFR